jgi:hypothetical protein
MAILAKSSGNTDYEPVPQGTHMGRCIEIVHIGTIKSEYKGQEKWREKVRITFELPEETRVFREENGPQPFVISTELTLSLADASVMLPFLETWRGKAFTEEERAGFDISRLLGAPGLVSVKHEQSNGKTYANISGVSPLMRGQVCPPQVNPGVVWSVNEFDAEQFKKFPAFLQDKIKSSKEYQAQAGGGQGGTNGTGSAAQPAPEPATDDLGGSDPLPF